MSECLKILSALVFIVFVLTVFFVLVNEYRTSKEIKRGRKR